MMDEMARMDPPSPGGFGGQAHTGGIGGQAGTDGHGHTRTGTDGEVGALRVYLAARFARAREMQLVSQVLARWAGVQITSRWHDGAHEVKKDLDEAEQLRQFAMEDLEDINYSNAVVLFTDEHAPLGGASGGRHFECGYALRGGKQVIVCGHPENVFHHLPSVLRVPDRSQLLQTLLFASRPARIPVPLDNVWEAVDAYLAKER